MTSNSGPTWPPRRPKIRKNGSKKFPCSSQKRVRNTTFNFNTVLDRLGLDFGGSWGGFWDPRRPQDPPKTPLRRLEPLPRRPQSPQRRPNRLQAASKTPRACQGQKTAKNKAKNKALPATTQNLRLHSAALIAFFQTTKRRNENMGRRYSPQGGLQ